MTGLTSEEVKARIESGKVNINDHPVTRTYKQIIRDNVLTFFNFLNIVLFVMVLLVGSVKNSFFIMIIVINTVIGVVQEIRAKKVIDELAIMTQPKAAVIRDGQQTTIETEQLVLDDVIVLKTGDQVPADCQVLEGGVEVNESLLTGESDNLAKKEGDGLYSGSFVTAGEASCRVTHVGKDNYVSRITSEAKEFRRHNSELRNSLNAILKFVSIIIVPLGALLFYKQHFMMGESFQASVVGTVAAVLGMIPEGLILLTSVTLTIGAVRLAMKNTLVQELYCIETLAKVDTLCLDKTGTITEGTMKVEEVIPCAPPAEKETQPEKPAPEVPVASDPEQANGFVMVAAPEEKADSAETRSAAAAEGDLSANAMSISGIESVMGNLMAALRDQNATADALRERFPVRHDKKASCVIPFSSDRKYSGAAFAGEGTWLMGAVQFLFPEGAAELEQKVKSYAENGFRVLVLAHSKTEADGPALPPGLSPAALLVLTDVIREEAPRTMEYFLEQGVDIKVISGDDPVTVSAVAKRAGVPNAENYIDASMLHGEKEMFDAVRKYSVFGRVTPQQKKEMVLALKAAGHTVAMTGDGVNDVLALKEADCSVAMAAGSSAAKNVANVVLLDSNFASMPHIVNQGRRVVNNIRTAASMFLIKTIFSIMLALVTIFAGNLYPFEPIQMSLISACAVGIPTFFLSQEDNYDRVDHTFLRHVFMNAFPAAMTITGCVLCIMLISDNVYRSTTMLNTACFLVTGWNYMAALKTVYAPLNKYRVFIIYSMQLIFFVASVAFQGLLSMRSLEYGMIVLVFVLMTFSPLLIGIITEWIRRTYEVSLDSPEKKWYMLLLERLRAPGGRTNANG